MTVGQEEPGSAGTLRALVLYDRPLVVDLIHLTLNHGLFVVRAARSLAEANTIPSDWQPHLVVVDIDDDDSSDLLGAWAPRPHSPERHAGPRTHPARRPHDEAARVRPRRRRHPDGALLARGAAGPLDRHHAPCHRDRATDRADDPSGRDRNRHRRSRGARRRLRHRPVRHRAEPARPSWPAGPDGSSRARILDAIWGTDFVAESNIVDRHIRSLRVKLQNDYRQPRFIATVLGEGYRFIPTFTNTGWDGGPVEGEPPRP